MKTDFGVGDCAYVDGSGVVTSLGELTNRSQLVAIQTNDEVCRHPLVLPTDLF
jgi:hypothetical protein